MGSNYHMTKVLLTHDGINTSITEYGQVFSGSSIGNVAASILGGNIILQLSGFGNATTTNVFVKVLSTSLVV
jgi:hypothetical protein